MRALQRLLPGFPNPEPVTPLVRLEGEIGRGGRVGRSLNLPAVEQALERAFRTPGAEAVAISVNSPGGAAVQSKLIHDRIRALADEYSLPVFVFCEDIAASGGYMIACAGDEIFAEESSLVGSVGVVGASFGAHRALERWGLERRIYTAGKNKVRLDPFRPETHDDRAFVARIQTAIHESFIALVQTRRSGKLDETAELFEGDVWTGLDAVRLGLIDGVGDVRSVLREKFGDKVRIKPINTERRSVLRRFAAQSGVAATGSDAALAEAAAGAAVETLLDALESRALWARFGL